jgi:hypothetical protein
MDVINGQATCTIHKAFLDYMYRLPGKDGEIIKEQLVEQQLETLLMRQKPDNPFYGDEEGFEKYCKVKYKILYDHIIRVIDALIAGSRR